MPMKLKLDAENHVVVQDGKPVYVADDGKEIPFDAEYSLATITRLNGEAKGHREAKEAAEGKLKLFEGIEDPDAARAALETIGNLDAGKLVAAGKVEEIKLEARKAAEATVAAAQKKFTEDLASANEENARLTNLFYNEKVGGSFNRSKFIAEKVAIPPDMMQSQFGRNFKVEDGKVVGYYANGEKIYSRVKAGDLAEFDEAIELIVDDYPNRDHILKGTGGGGGGRQGSGNGANGAKQIVRSAFDKLDPAAKIKTVSDGVAIVDG